MTKKYSTEVYSRRYKKKLDHEQKFCRFLGLLQSYLNRCYKAIYLTTPLPLPKATPVHITEFSFQYPNYKLCEERVRKKNCTSKFSLFEEKKMKIGYF